MLNPYKITGEIKLKKSFKKLFCLKTNEISVNIKRR